jgi:hypothetical protein
MKAGAPDVAATLVRLTRKAKTERVQLDAARALGAALGMTRDDGQGGGPGAGLVLNLHFNGSSGTLLTQGAPRLAQVIDHAPLSEPDPHRVEGAGPTRSPKRARTQRATKGGEGGGGPVSSGAREGGEGLHTRTPSKGSARKSVGAGNSRGDKRRGTRVRQIGGDGA